MKLAGRCGRISNPLSETSWPRSQPEPRKL
jgi:hypothetical protein